MKLSEQTRNLVATEESLADEPKTIDAVQIVHAAAAQTVLELTNFEISRSPNEVSSSEAVGC